MIYIKVPKEIKEYRARAVLGLTYRQIEFLVIGAALGLLTSIILSPIIGLNGISVVIILFIVPFIVIGFTDVDGIPMEQFVKYIFTFYRQKQTLSYESTEIYTSNTEGGTTDDKSIKEKIREYKQRRRIQQEQDLLLEDGTKKATKKEKKSAKRNSLSKDV